MTELTRYRHNLGFEKFPKYLTWMHRRFPNMELHHILGSCKGKRFTDALVMPLTREDHAKAHKRLPHYFNIHLTESFLYFIQYLEETSPDGYKFWVTDCKPSTIKTVIELAIKLGA